MTKRALMFALPFVLLCSGVWAQTVKKSTLSGTVTTAGVTAPANMMATLLTTPVAGAGFFILTQACTFGSSNTNITFSTVTIRPGTGGNPSCLTFDPGLAVPASTPVVCDNTAVGFPVSCLVTGVLSTK